MDINNSNRYLMYIPHGINSEIFFPIDKDIHTAEYARLLELKSQIFANKGEPEFVVLYNNRNIRRKLVTNVILAFNKFVQELPKEKQEKAVLILHTAPVDENGTDLPAVVSALTPKCNVVFSASRVAPNDLNALYNLSDVVMSMSNAEGFGLATAEGLMSGRMIIATVTGGLQDQMRFEDENGKWINFDAEFQTNHRGKYKKCGEWAIPLFPDAISLTGSIPTPYIYESYVDWPKGSEALHKVYNIPKEERIRIGIKAREWMLSEESGMSSINMAQRFITGIDKTFKDWKPRKRFALYKI